MLKFFLFLKRHLNFLVLWYCTYDLTLTFIFNLSTYYSQKMEMESVLPAERRRAAAILFSRGEREKGRDRSAEVWNLYGTEESTQTSSRFI